jgi:hypothetical protein
MIKLRVLALACTAALSIAGSARAQGQTPAATAERLFKEGEFDRAAAVYAAMLHENAGDRAAQIGLAAIELYQNDLAAAYPLLQSAISADPSDQRAAALWAELQRRLTEARKKSVVTGGEADVPFVTSDPLPVIHASVNGVPGTFVVDTGGTLILESAFAKALKLQVQAAGYGVFAGGKRAPVATATIDSIALGGATAYDVPVNVMQTHAGELFPGVTIDGIVGTTLFERFLVTIDYPRHRLIVRPRDAATSDALLAAAKKENASIVPCWLVGDHFVMARAQVNDVAPGLFFFDSGLAGGGLMPSPELVKVAGITLDQTHAASGVGGGGRVTAVPFVVNRIIVGTAVQHDIPGVYTPQGNPFGIFPFTVWGIISDTFLRHYAYTVDFDAMKIVLAP